MISAQTKPEIFFVKSDEIQGRFDPYFYRPEFLELDKKFENSNLEIKKLGEIASFQYGLGEVAEDNGDLIYLRITDIDENGNLKKDGLKYLSSKASFNNYILNKGDILVARTGATFGKTFYFNENFNATFGGFLIRINLNENVLSKFYFYFAQTNIYWNLANRLVSGGGQPQFNANTICDLKIPVPPKEIQNQIIDLMDNAYNLKRQNEQEAKGLIESVDDYVLDELGIKIPKIEDKMTFIVKSIELENNRIDVKYHQEKYKIIQRSLESGKYEIKKLKNFLTGINMGISIPGLKNKNEKIPFILGKNLKKGYLDLDDQDFISENINNNFKKSILIENQVLFSIRGVYIGKVAVVPKSLVGGNIINNIVSLDIKNIKPSFVVNFLNSEIGQKLIYKNVWGGAQPGITNEQIRNLQIPLPPINIQEKIAKEVKSRLGKAEKLKQEAKENFEQAKQEVEKILLG